MRRRTPEPPGDHKSDYEPTRLHADRRLVLLEIWVGNAKQAAYFYENARLHSRGPRRPGDRRSRPGLLPARAGGHPPRADERLERTVRSAAGRQRRGTASETSPSPFDASNASTGRPSGAVLAASSSRRWRTTRAASRARRDHEGLRRQHPHVRQPLRVRGTYLPGYQSVSRNGPPSAGDRPDLDRPRRRQRRGSGGWTSGSAYERVLGFSQLALLGRGHLDRVLGAHVEGDDGQ